MRIVIVKSTISPTWQSCVYIVRNLIEAYQKSGNEILEVFSSEIAEQNKSTSHQIYKFKPEHIIFIDYRAHTYLGLLKEIALRFRKTELQLSFHVYGNFTIEPFSWLAIGSLIKDFSVRFICASTRQASLFASFLDKNSIKTISVCPFPVNTETFFFDSESRASVRKELGWENNFVITYAGRITPQKNVIPMLSHLLKLKQPNLKIVLAGIFDNMNAPLFKGGTRNEGFYRSEYLNFVTKLPEKKRNQIDFQGSRPQNELREIFNASDLFVCWSTYHDEDFGMAAAEALCTGLPSILTSWGGLSDFKNSSKICNLVPVKIDDKGIQVNTNVFDKSLSVFHKSRRSLESKRALRANEFAELYSVSGIAKKMNAVLAQPTALFRGFNSKLKEQAQLIQKDFGSQIYSKPSQKDKLYFSNYSHYSGQK